MNSLVNCPVEKSSVSERVLLSEKYPNLTSLIKLGVKTCVSPIETVLLRSLRRSVVGEARLFGSGNESSPGKLAKNNVPLSVFLDDNCPSSLVVNWCCVNSEG